MILRYNQLSSHPKIFLATTGLKLTEFYEVVADVKPALLQSQLTRLERPKRRRDIGGGRKYQLDARDQILLTIVWLRLYPTHEVLGYLFGVSDSTVSRTIALVLPLLEAAGRASMRMPDPGRRHRHTLDEVLAATPELVVIVDSFEQAVQRPRDHEEADRYYSGKKKRHTLKSQIAINELNGQIVDVSESVYGPTADVKLLEQSKLLDRLPKGVGVIGDLAYLKLAELHPQGLGAAPRRKPRGQARPEADKLYNTAFSKRRIRVEHTIGRLRRYESLAQTDRNHREDHQSRVIAVSGLVNLQFRHRFRLAA